MGCKCGIIGLPNVGKSTLFNILTNSKIPAKNFPFCTIKPNIGFSPVFDIRLNKISEIVCPKNIVTSMIEFVDIAGLVQGASKGLGLGNKFLSDIQKTNAILHVVRCFDDDKIVNVHDKINPKRDIEIINMELILSDLQICQKLISQLERKNSITNTIENKKIKILNICLQHLQDLQMIKTLQLQQLELELIQDINFITLKPIIYIINFINNTKNDIFFQDLLNSNILGDDPVIKVNILQEEKKKYLFSKNTKNIYLEEFKNSKINKIIKLTHNLLNLQNFFTVGKKEVRSWTILKNTKIIDAAKIIHTDFKKGFIRAQVMHYLDFIKFKSESKVRELGKLRLEGKKYIVQDGDIIKFLFKV